MKKRILGVLLATAMIVGTLAGCGASSSTSTASSTAASTATSAAATEEDTGSVQGTNASQELYDSADLTNLKGKKIGITIQSLANAYWAGVMTALEEQLKAAGADVTIVECKDNSGTQIGQVENFISSKCDLIMIHPSDADAVEDVAKSAMDAGIKVMCWDDPMTNTNGNWILDNTTLGVEIGKLAGDFINEHFSEDNKAEVAVLGYPQTKVLLERGNGIKEGLKETADGKYEIVAEQPALEPSQAQTATETILQKNPNLKVVVGIGAGPMIGANEALTTYTNGKVPEDMGVFTTDVTKQQLEQIKSGDQASKGIIGFEGSDEDTAKACEAMFSLILADKLPDQNIFRTVAKIDNANVDSIMAGMK
jgi:ribose transport system substrate-binding protein